MYRDEEVGIVAGSELGAVDEGDEHLVLLAGHEDRDAGIEVLDLLLKKLGDFEDESFLICLAVLADSAGVLSSVTGIDDDGTQSKRFGILGGRTLETAENARCEDCGTVYDSFQIHLRTLVK